MHFERVSQASDCKFVSCGADPWSLQRGYVTSVSKIAVPKKF